MDVRWVMTHLTGASPLRAILHLRSKPDQAVNENCGKNHPDKAGHCSDCPEGHEQKDPQGYQEGPCVVLNSIWMTAVLHESLVIDVSGLA